MTFATVPEHHLVEFHKFRVENAIAESGIHDFVNLYLQQTFKIFWKVFLNSKMKMLKLNPVFVFICICNSLLESS